MTSLWKASGSFLSGPRPTATRTSRSFGAISRMTPSPKPFRPTPRAVSERAREGVDRLAPEAGDRDDDHLPACILLQLVLPRRQPSPLTRADCLRPIDDGAGEGQAGGRRPRTDRGTVPGAHKGWRDQ